MSIATPKTFVPSLFQSRLLGPSLSAILRFSRIFFQNLPSLSISHPSFQTYSSSLRLSFPSYPPNLILSIPALLFPLSSVSFRFPHFYQSLTINNQTTNKPLKNTRKIEIFLFKIKIFVTHLRKSPKSEHLFYFPRNAH